VGGIARTIIGVALGLGALLVVGYLAFLILVMSSFGDCGPAEVGASVTADSVLLDGDHPYVEQHVTVRINAEAMPADLEDRPTLSVTLTEPPPPIGSRSSIQVIFVPDDTGAIESRTGTPEPLAGGRFDASKVTLDCVVGSACERTYRIILSRAEADGDAAVQVGWTTSAGIEYVRSHYSRCGPPDDAHVEVEGERPLRGDNSQFAHGVIGPMRENGAMVVRRVSVVGDGGNAAPVLTWGRLTADAAEPTGEAWRAWARVIDEEGKVVADGALTEAYGGERAATIDFPIRAGCMSTRDCEATYWVALQSFPSAPEFGSAEPSNIGELEWHLETTSLARPGEAAGDLAIQLDGDPVAVPGDIVSVGGIGMRLDETDTRHTVDVAFSVRLPPAPVDGFDPLDGTVAIIAARGSGVGVVMTVEGDGAGSIRGHANGDGRWNLISHPFDECEPDVPCQGTVRLVAEYAGPQQYGPQEEGATVDWVVTLVGAPEGTVGVPGAVNVEERSLSDFVPPWPIAVLLSTVILALVAAGWYLLRRPQSGA